MESIVEQLRHIQIDIDILRDHRYKDRNEIVAYLIDIQYSQNTILEQLDNFRCSQRGTNDHLRSLEARVEQIDFHIHDRVGYFAALPVMSPIPLLDSLPLVLVSFCLSHNMLRPQSHPKIMHVNCLSWYSPAPISKSLVGMRERGLLRAFL